MTTVTDLVSAVTPKGGVYTLRDDSGNVVRTGRTTNLAARKAQHDKAYSGDYSFKVEHRTDVYAEQRGLEHMLYEENKGTAFLNKIKAIADKNPRKGEHIQAAKIFLSRLAK